MACALRGWFFTDDHGGDVCGSVVVEYARRAAAHVNVIQLEALPTQRDEVEEGSIRPENESKLSFPKSGEV